jgi:peptidoglycan hydrolase-like protein with peptidoglycan-binding domain
MRRRLTAVTVLAVLVAAAVAIGVLTLGEDPRATATDAAEVATVAVERRTLTDEERVSGELGHTGERQVTAGAAPGTLTWLPADGRTVRRGQVAYRVDDEPVVLLTGRLPLWRTLAYGVDDGADVAQLERNLEALGHDPGTVDEEFTTYTREAVEDLQEELGVEETGEVGAAGFLVLPGAIRVGAAQAGVGDQLQPGTPLYDATGTGKVVTVDLDPSEEALAAVGRTATVTLPDGSTTKARITEVGTVATATSADTEQPSADATIPVTLELVRPRAARGLTAAPVTVDLTRATRKDVLTVPVTALVALAEGGFAIRREGGELVGVETGLHAGGRVEITSGLAEGDRVEVPA